MTITQKAQDFFGARAVTIRGSRQLWGRSFKRRFDLTNPRQAEIAMRRYEWNSAQYERWQQAMEMWKADQKCWETPLHCYHETFMDGNPDHKFRDPVTFLKVTRHRK